MPKIQIITGVIKECDVEKLENLELIEGIIGRAAEFLDLTVLKTISHKFSPLGLTSVSLLAESHIAVHTYPEESAIFVDVMSCGKRDAMKVFDMMEEGLDGRTEIVQNDVNYIGGE
ncbi:MAG: adenosylmethionine decarboxylase [Halobacteriota archaeon]|nr:adenosylmethionine decarboxylase [Halobacteriota archaeon]